MITGEQIVETARTFLGYPYAAQGRDEYGIDCGGLISLVCKKLNITDADLTGYASSPDGETFEKILSENLDEVIPKENVQLGDIIACDYGLGIQHTAFVTQLPNNPYFMIIHAKRRATNFKNGGVIEHRLMAGMEDYDCWVKTFRIRENDNYD